MAEMLMLLEKDPGKISVIKPDGSPWGTRERPPRFAVIKVPGVPVWKLSKYAEPEQGPVMNPDGTIGVSVIRQRRWKVQLKEFPVAIKTLLSLGVLTVQSMVSAEPANITWEEFRSFIKDEIDEIRETVDL